MTSIERSHLPSFPGLLTQILLEDGVDVDALFEGLGFDRKDLSNEKFRLSADQHQRFITRALDLSGNLHLAMDVSKRAFSVGYSAFLMAIANAGRISRALHLITRYNRIYTRTLTVQFGHADQGVVLEVESHVTDEAVTYFAVSSLVFFIDFFFKDALGGKHLVQRAEMAMRKPDGFDQISGDLGFEMQFGCPRNRVFLDPDLIDAPLKYADPQTVRLITDVCEKQLQEGYAEEGAAGAVTSLVLDHLSSPPNLEQAAAMLGLSGRNLRRKLKQSGTTYQSILDSARQRLAIKLLLETDEPVASIAYELGFEHPSHFGRAFKKWTGQSPSAYRHR
ncbi:MAG: AraC family transcriptional regulator [Rhodobiaceae bacterium]|nr:AraC family transcriptional regulator [Rhodobiaceae bacterium]